jgi:hypothetical protein
MLDVVRSEPGLKICLDETMDHLVMRKDVGVKRVFVSPDTWDTIATHVPAMDAFMVMAREHVAGFRLLDAKVEPWASAATAAQAEGIGAPEDRLEVLRMRVQTLVAASASAVRPDADPAQVDALMQQHAVAQRDLQVLLQQVQEVQALLDIASRKVCGL